MSEQSQMHGSTVDHYYGKNDKRPLRCVHYVFVVIVLVMLFLFGPDWLVRTFIYFFCGWLVVVLILVCCWKFSPGQMGAIKITHFDFFWYKAPGRRLEVRSAGVDISDIIIPEDFVRQGNLSTCKGCSLRKSIECSVDAHIHEGPHGVNIAEDTDVHKPRYHLHGRILPYDPSTCDELWTNTARFCHWPAMYSWSAHLPQGRAFSEWTDKIALESLPEVLGYIVLFEVTNAEFFDGGSRTSYVGAKALNCPKITPQNEGKLFVRYNKPLSYDFGNLPSSEPDAYIFKGKTLKDAQMKVLHTYRLMKPDVEKSAVELGGNV